MVCRLRNTLDRHHPNQQGTQRAQAEFYLAECYKNLGRKEKALWTEHDRGERIALYHAMDERDEASFIAAMTRKLISGGENPGGIAVLYRTNA